MGGDFERDETNDAGRRIKFFSERINMNRIRAWLRLKMGWIPRPVRRAIVSVIGGTLLLLALVGMVLPIMPGVIFLPFGLAILAIEFAWAARWLKKLRTTAGNVKRRVRSGLSRAPDDVPDHVAEHAADHAAGEMGGSAAGPVEGRHNAAA